VSIAPTETDVKAAAKEAVEFAREHFQVSLDFSLDSIKEVERILARFHDELPKGFVARIFRRAPEPEKTFQILRLFGSYVGEVLRSNLAGSRWEMDSSRSQGVLSLTDGEKRLWPHTKVHHRIVNGSEDNIWHYSQAVIEHWNAKDAQAP